MSTLKTARRGSVPGALVVALLAGLPLVSACADGQKAPTRLEYEVADGVQTNAGNVVLRNLQLVADTGDTEGGATTLTLTGTIANNTGSSDTLTSVTAASGGVSVPFGRQGTQASLPTIPASASTSSASASTTPSASASASASAGPAASTTPSAAPVVAAPAAISAKIPVGQPLVLGQKGLALEVNGLIHAALPGSVVPVTFTFTHAGSVTVAIPVYSASSRTPSASQSPVSFPPPQVQPSFNQPEFDNASAAPPSGF